MRGKPKIEGWRNRIKDESMGIVRESDAFLRLPKEDDLVPPAFPRPPRPIARSPRRTALTKFKLRVGQRGRAAKQRWRGGLSRAVALPKTATGALSRRLHSPVLILRRHRGALASGLILFLLAFTFIKGTEAKENFSVRAESARANLSLALDNIETGDLGEALKAADLARADLYALKVFLQAWGQDIKYLSLLPSHGSELVAAEKLLNNTYSLLSAASLFNEAAVIEAEGGKSITVDIKKISTAFSVKLGGNKELLTKSRRELESISPDLPLELRMESQRAVKIIDKAQKNFDLIIDLLTYQLPWLSAETGGERRILVLFQNNSELRGGSGGSLGSFGLARFADGKLKEADFGTNIYKIDKPFKQREKIAPPGELNWILADGYWVMKDSGWAVDGPEALEKVVWFYEKETGNRADGVIVVDTTAFTSLLAEVGGIELPQYGKTIDAENFKTEIEYEVHKGYFDRPGGKEENEPKKILTEMMPLFLEKFFAALGQKEKAAGLASAISRSVKQKHLFFYFRDSDLQKTLEQLNYAAKVYPTIGDYLYVNSSNLAGAKSSLSIAEKIRLNVNISGSGKITNNLRLARSHQGRDEWPDGVNKNYVRMLMPDGSKVNSFDPVAGNFQRFYTEGYLENKPYWMSREAGKEVVNFWMSTAPGEASEALISYEPNCRVDTSGDFNYNLLVQKQPGAPAGELELEVTYPKGFVPANVNNYDFINRKVLIRERLDSDKEFSLRFRRVVK
ncbi:MAG: DUF4012 domain-containing protein [Patescibacteria group bacterium]|mgnify:CR=1 FL=1